MNSIQKIRTDLAYHKPTNPNMRSHLTLPKSTSSRCLQPLSLSSFNTMSQFQFSPRSTHKNPYSQQPPSTSPSSLEEQCRQLQILCLREQIQIQSYVKMIDRLKKQMEDIKQANNDIYQRTEKQKETIQMLKFQQEELESKGLSEVQRILEEVEMEERSVRRTMIRRGSRDLGVRDIQQRVSGMSEEVEQLRKKMLQEENRCELEFKGMMLFIGQLEADKEKLTKQIIEWEEKDKDSHVYVRDYQKIC